jgi:hypothetical protein
VKAYEIIDPGCGRLVVSRSELSARMARGAALVREVELAPDGTVLGEAAAPPPEPEPPPEPDYDDGYEDEPAPETEE